jgi:hypothetical protein
MLEGLGGSFGGLVEWVMGWMVVIGGGAAVIFGGWHLLKVLLAGGHGREAWKAVVGLLVLAVGFAMLADWRATFELAGFAGGQIKDVLYAELRSGMTTWRSGAGAAPGG